MKSSNIYGQLNQKLNDFLSHFDKVININIITGGAQSEQIKRNVLLGKLSPQPTGEYKGLPLFRAVLMEPNKTAPGSYLLYFLDPLTGKSFQHGRSKGSDENVPQHRISHIYGSYEDGYYILPIEGIYTN